jgi:beta-1,4-mannosyl-glycoprotein beta-1,4-N-acetylglucosaminyltransferase
MFFNEIEILELRLEELNDVVDFFVIVEAGETHSGLQKEKIFEKNKNKFERFSKKIIHLVIDKFPENLSNWGKENFQRRYIGEGIKKCEKDDWIIISDIDEIPDPKSIQKLKNQESPVQFVQKLYYYYLNCFQNQPWNGTIMVKKRDLKDIQEIRNNRGNLKKIYKDSIVCESGWHFSFVGGKDKISEKLISYAETQTNTKEINNLNNIEKCLETGDDLFGRKELCFKKNFVLIDSSFPEKINFIINKYGYLVKKGEI